MTNASDTFFAGGQGLLYPLGSEAQWIGRPRGGMVITEPREEQQRDINTQAPLFWDAERTRPKTQLVFTVVCDGSGPAAQHGWNTNERVDAQDRGHRDVYVKGKDKTEAVKAELARHGRTGLRIGDHYYECLTGTRPGKLGTARTWAAMLFPGAGPDQAQFFGNEQQAPPPAAPQQPQGFGQQAPPAQTPAPAPQGNAYGFGHQPPASPGGQAYAAAQQPSQGFGAPPAAAPAGPPPQFGAPPAAYQAPPSVQQHYAPTQQPGGAFNGMGDQPGGAPMGFGAQPQGFAQQAPPAPQQVPPADDPWGRAAPAANPYGG